MAWSRRHRVGDRLASASGDPRAAVESVVSDLFADDAWVWIRRNLEPAELVERMLVGPVTQRTLFASLLELYATRRGGLAVGQGIVGEKTPSHLYQVPLLARWFPTSRFVHTFRDPRGIYASELRRARQGRWGLKARLPRMPQHLLDPLLPPIEAVATLRAWLDAARLHRRYTAELEDRYMLVRFEDLVAQPEREVRAICDFVGIAFDSAMLEGVDVVGSSFSDERHAAPGVDARAADRWREDVHPVIRRWFAFMLGPRLGRFGYRS